MIARGGVVGAGLWFAVAAFAAEPAPGERGTPLDEPRGSQHETKTPPPSAPAATPTDPGAPIPALPPTGEPRLQLRREPESATPAQSPARFNPDPGAAFKPAPVADVPFFKTQETPPLLRPEEQPVPADRALPRSPLERTRFELAPAAAKTGREGDPLPAELALPRARVRENRFIPNAWHAPEEYPLTAAGRGYPANTTPVPDRWRSTGFEPWRRYTAGDTNELPYYRVKPDLWHHYRQSILKGDLPIHGQDLFLNLTASSDVVAEDRRLTVPSGASAARPGSFDFYGENRSQILVGNAAFQADLFRGETVFKPVEWLVRVKLIFNYNRVSFREAGLISPDPRGQLGAGHGVTVDNRGVLNPGDIDGLLNRGLTTAPADYSGSRHTVRPKNYLAVQELFFEKHLGDLSANYDFYAVKVGHQTFNSDFRGLIFNDTNLGARFFGNYDSNRWQYNAAVFDLREKDTNSELNTFDRRGQVVVIANVYRQDFWKHGYTAQLSFHASFDRANTHYDTNGGIVRPAPIGTVLPHGVNSYYLGWAGDGHLDRWNLSHAAYLVLGRDGFNGIAGRPVDIFAQMAAVELSYDHDWLRYKGSFLSASGDRHPGDTRATGFASILDNTNFTGGPFSYYARQGFNLGGTALGLKQRFSLLPDLRTSKTEGQQNFVNPGLLLLGCGVEADLTPRLRAFANANALRFATAAPIKAVLLTNQADEAFGTDLSVGVQWRPLLTQNIVVSAGYGALLPARGFRDIFRTTQPAVPGFTAPGATAVVDRFLHSAILAVSLTY
ncbi:MAG: hypothetical protein EXS32_06630 [Opitutus sp.]|nr:hypothetical protein [Opitutus sp.]